jgi:chitin disaccharide deacetylase
VRVERSPALIITADDYGYHPSYDEGILEAAGAGAVDAVGAMVLRPGIDPEALLRTGVEIGLHLELPPGGPSDRAAGVAALRDQLGRFEELFERPAAYLDGHHHCHARGAAAAALAAEVAARGLPVRSVDAAHRAMLRRVGAMTPDRLVGRTSEEAEAALPAVLRPVVEDGGELPTGVTEWMVHPGHPDSASGSDYDLAREEDLDLLLSLSLEPTLSAARLGHLAALA